MDKYTYYLNAFMKTVEAYNENPDREIMKRTILYGVKMINSEPKAVTYEEAQSGLRLASMIKDLMGLVTPEEFMNIFPIEKDFKGHKWETKDYFYTVDYISSLDIYQPIGEDVLEFLWEYHNMEVRRFNVALMRYMDDLRRLEGKPSFAEEWADMNGINTYTLHTDQKGKEYMIDKAGKTVRVKKPRPKYLKLVH